MVSLTEICVLLESVYGRPDYRPEYSPLDELVLTILSQSTTSVNYNRAFARLRDQFETWGDVHKADPIQIENTIRCGGLAKIKTERIRNMLNQLAELHGELTLDFLADMDDAQARDYLMQFCGVGIKTASCVLMFSLGRAVFPVDTHVHRITYRLGLIDSSVNPSAAHDILRPMIPDHMVYSLHINLVAHGRRVCKARNPACDICTILPKCLWGQKFLASWSV